MSKIFISNNSFSIENVCIFFRSSDVIIKKPLNVKTILFLSIRLMSLIPRPRVIKMSFRGF